MFISFIKSFSKLKTVFFSFIFMFPGRFVWAQSQGGGSVPGQGGGSVPGQTGDKCTIGCIDNPLGKIDSIPQFVKELLDIVLTIGVPIVALAIIYSGFLFVKAQGKPEEIKQARKSFTYTIIGAAILLGAYVLAEAIGGTISQIRG